MTEALARLKEISSVATLTLNTFHIQVVQCCLDFEWLGIYMVQMKPRPFYLQTKMY